MDERFSTPIIMSVLNDIIVQNGEWIRNIASELPVSDSKQFMLLTKRLPHIRMDSAEYKVEITKVPAGIAQIVNHYWDDGEGNYWWGIPGGKYTDFIDRLISYPKDWRGNEWYPNLDRCTSEVRARDLLLATYLFPFKIKAKHCDPSMKMVIFQVLSRIHRTKVVTGSNVLADFLIAVDSADDLYADILPLMSSPPENIIAESMDFNQWSTYYSVCTSTNTYDAKEAAKSANMSVDEYRLKGANYVSIAELANACKNAGILADRRGRIGKQVQDNMKCLDSNSNYEAWEIDNILEKPYRDLMANTNVGGKSLAYRLAKAPDVRMVSARGITLIYSKHANKLFIVTDEQIKALKFVSMTHSMWNLHASTIPAEYKEGVRLDPVNEQAVATALGQISTIFENVVADVSGVTSNKIKQTVVPKNVTLDSVSNIWKFYISKLINCRENGTIDYLGRYLHELFEIYTAKVAGHLAVEGLKVQMEEFVETYSNLGFTPLADAEDFTGILLSLPMSCAQDFGRLSKIVLPYEVDPIYSYIARVNAMHKPNPIGRAVFHDDYRFDIAPHTIAEDKDREVRYKCACRVMIAMADMRTNAIEALSAEAVDRLGGANAAWHDILTEAKRGNITIQTNFLVTNGATLDIPADAMEKARLDANEMRNTKNMPTNPYAGAYLDVSNIFSYSKRGEPDIAFIKPTAIPSSDPNVVFSNVSSVPRTGPTRDNEGMRVRGTGNMVSNYLADILPSRHESLAFLAHNVPIATTSDKIETNKYPLKTRIITALCGEARRIMSEFEYNNGRSLAKCPGFTVGADPADVKRSMYAAMKDDLLPGQTTLYISLDLSSWSTGMHWDIQKWTNTMLHEAYEGADDVMNAIDRCTIGSYMVRSEKGMRLFSVNDLGANYEGVDGKRNTFMHAVIWYIARCDAYDSGVEGTMRAALFIDDGAASIRVDKKDLLMVASILRRSLVATYVRYGFKLSMLKSVMSETYSQFLNEIYMHGIHIGYGFRALCHTAAQSFPEVATVAEEIAVITGGIRGAAVSGGNPVRLIMGMNYILQLYMRGVIGNKGRSISNSSGFISATLFAMPTIAGGFGIPNYTQLFSNLAGHREAEKLARVTFIMRSLKSLGMNKSILNTLEGYMRGKLREVAEVNRKKPPDRIGVSHPASAHIGAHDRSTVIAEAALKYCKNYTAENLITRYINNPTSANSYAYVFIEGFAKNAGRLPVAILDKALATDPNQAISNLVEKIASSGMVSKLLTRNEIRILNRKYFSDARDLASGFSTLINIA